MKRNIKIMFIIALLQGLVFYAPISTLYRQAYGLNIFQISIIESICLALCLLLELPWGLVADKIGYRRSFIICCLLYVVSKFIFWQASDFNSFLLERIILSIVLSGISGVDNGILYLSDPDNNQKNYGIYSALGTVGLISATLVYSFLIKDNYRLASFLTMIGYFLAFIAALFLTEVKKEKSHLTLKGLLGLIKDLFGNKSLLFLVIATGIFTEVRQMIVIVISQVQYLNSGLSLSIIGIAYLVVTVGGLCSSLSAKVTKWLNPKRMIDLIYLSVFVSLFVLVFNPPGFISVFLILIMEIGFALFMPLSEDLQNKEITVPDRASALSVNFLMIDSLGVLIEVPMGYLTLNSLKPAYLFAIILMVGSFLFLKQYLRYRQVHN